MRILVLLIFVFPLIIHSQEDLLSELEQNVVEERAAVSAFKGLKVVNFESTKLADHKDLFFIVSHRFGTVKNGIDDFFGLDNAVTQLKFIYGVTDWLNIGIARSSLQKKYGGHVKYRLLQQKKAGFPVTVVGYNLITINTSLDEELLNKLEFADRLTFTHQLLLSRKVNKHLSILVAPTYIHENLATRSIEVTSEGEVLNFDEENDQFAVGVGGRIKISTRWSLNADYGFHLNRNENSNFNNPFSVGIDLETGGHVFQMHFTNAQGMFEEGYIIQAQGDWGDGDFFFGFNLSRVF